MTDLGPLIKNYLARRKKAGGGALAELRGTLGDLPDVGDPLIGDGGQFSPGTDWGNKAADIAGKLASGAAHGLVTLPRRAIENSQTSLDTGTYDPSTPMEAALMTMGAGAGARGGQRPVSPALDRPAEPAYFPTHEPDQPIPAAAEREAPVDVGGGLAGPSGGAAGLREAQLSAQRRASGRAALEGLPTEEQIVGGEPYIPGPVGTVHDVADRYMAARETPSYHKPPEKYHQIDKEHAAAIARAYDEMEHAPNHPAVQASYEALIRETLAQYQAIKESGLKITPVNGADYPYHDNPRGVARDVADNNHMAFFKTDEGFGTGDVFHPDNPMLRSSGEKIGEHDMLNNDLFRVVHDYFGHVKNGYGFRGAGEDNAWRAHAAMYSDIARPAMTTETRGQNSWVNYGPHGETNRTASGADTVYAPQKIGLMPEWTMRDRGSPDPIIGYQGSPTRFDKHDLAYMGTGEGNQSYGKGHYFAGHEPVAEWYRHQLSARRDPLLKKYGLDSEDGSNLGNRLAGKQGNIEPVIDGLQQEIMNLKSQGESKAVKNMIARREGMVNFLRDPERNKGHMYQVAIDHPPEKFLDWDKRINEHPPEVQEQIRQAMGIDYHGQHDPAKADRLWKQFQHSDTADALRRGFIASDDNLVAERLRNAGIPGIRYLDQGSRSLGQGTHNYVTFDAPRMLKRYAEGGRVGDDYNTPVDDEPAYQAWKALNAPNDSGVDYDLRGAYLANMQRAENGHMGDRFKKPNHPTFSDQSQYAIGDQRDRAGYWIGDTFVPPAMRASGGRIGYARGGKPVFDPTQPFEDVPEAAAKPVFDPTKPFEDVADDQAKLPAINIRPAESADHGLSERQKLSPLGKALSPITSYPETYQRMNEDAREQVSRGVGQITNPDSLIDPQAHGISDVLTGAGNVALGGLGYVSSPITAAYRSLIGQPVEDVTGIPREHTELAAQLATPGLGFTRMPKAPGAPTAPAPRVLPPHADVPASVERGDEFGLKYSLGQATKDLDRIRYEDMAARGAYGPAAQKQAAQFFEEQYAAMQEGTQRVGQQFAHGEQPLGGPADAAASLNAEVADRATSAQRMRDAVVARAEQAAEARRQQVAQGQQNLDSNIGQGRPLAEPREAGEIVNQNVRQAAADNRAEFRGHYDEFGRLPGEFDVSAVRGVGNRIRNDLTYRDNPVIIDEGTPAASRAVQALDEMSQPRITNRASPHAAPDPNEITAVTLRGVDQMRKRLVQYYQQARSSNNASDMRATRSVIDGFDNQIERAITENLFSGDPRALQVLQDARASYARYQRTFSPQGAGDDVGAAMRRIVDRNATAEETANMIIGSGKIGSAGLPVRIADRLEQVLGADSEAWSSIRQAMWQKASRVRNSAGEIDAARSARSVEDFSNSTLARRMFPPEDLAAMRSSARGARDLERVIEQLPETRAADQARTIYEQAFGGEQLSGSQRAVFRRMVDGTATPEETVQAMFSAIGSGNPGNTVRALQAVGRIVGRDSPTWAAIKQGVWQKLTQNPFGKDQKGQQKMVQGINEFLNGSGRSIARELYSHEDRALMNRFGEAVRQTIIPKYARTNSDTAPALLAAAHKYGPKLGALIGMGGHGPVSFAIGKAIDKGADMIAAARQSKKMGESFGDISATTPNPIAGIQFRPRSSRALLATKPPANDPSNPYAP